MCATADSSPTGSPTGIPSSTDSSDPNSFVNHVSQHNLNIFSWNIHGNLNLKYDSPEFVNVFNGNDFIFLNECWISYASKFELNGYNCYLKARKRKKRAKRDSGGLCVFIKNEINRFFELVEWENEDCFIFKIDKNYTNIGKDLYLFCCYMRPSTSTRNSFCDNLDVYDLLFNKITELRNENEIIIVGDLNSRCSTLQDYIVNDSCSNFDPVDDLVYNSNCITQNDLIENNISFSRMNEDSKCNDFGYKLINLCKISGLLICNGRLPGDKFGSFTYFDKKGKSTVDFALISKGLLSLCNDFCVNLPSAFSDHSAIKLYLSNVDLHDHVENNTVNNYNMSVPINISSYPICNFEINKDNTSSFLSNMDDDYACTNLNSILDILDTDISTLDVTILEDCITGLNHVIEYASTDCIKHIPSHNNCSKKRKPINLWYDIDCKNKKKEFDIAKDRYLHNLQDDDLKYFCKIRNEYRKLCRLKKNNVLI